MDTLLGKYGRTLRASVLLASITMLMSGCGHGQDVVGLQPRLIFHPPIFGPRDSVFTDDQLLSAAYSSYSVPPGFYEEPETVPVYYVNDGSIQDWHVRPPLPWTELATDDTAQARAWAQACVANSNAVARVAPDAPLVTPRYIEFQDEPGPGVTHVRMRVHRASYVSDIPTWISDASSLYGTFHARPVDEDNVQPLVEYLWTHHGERFRFGPKVLSCFSTASPEEIAQTMYVVQLAHGDFGLPDQIVLSRLVYRVARTTGVMHLAVTRLRDRQGLGG